MKSLHIKVYWETEKITGSMFVYSRVIIVLATIESFHHSKAFKEMTHKSVQVIVFPYLRPLFDSIPSLKKLTLLADTLTRRRSYVRMVLTVQCLCHIGSRLQRWLLKCINFNLKRFNFEKKNKTIHSKLLTYIIFLLHCRCRWITI